MLDFEMSSTFKWIVCVIVSFIGVCLLLFDIILYKTIDWSTISIIIILIFTCTILFIPFRKFKFIIGAIYFILMLLMAAIAMYSYQQYGTHQVIAGFQGYLSVVENGETYFVVPKGLRNTYRARIGNRSGKSFKMTYDEFICQNIYDTITLDNILEDFYVGNDFTVEEGRTVDNVQYFTIIIEGKETSSYIYVTNMGDYSYFNFNVYNKKN